MGGDIRVLVRRGADMVEWFDDVARLRAEVFRAFPYLYEGDAEYEKHYLATYARSAGSVLVLVLAGDAGSRTLDVSSGARWRFWDRPSPLALLAEPATADAWAADARAAG